MKFKATIMSGDGIARDRIIEFLEGSYVEKDGFYYRNYENCYRTPKECAADIIIFVIDKDLNFRPELSDPNISNVVYLGD